MFTYKTSCRRKAFRLCPSEADPIIITFMGKSVSLIEISAGGASFNNQGFKQGDSDNVRFSLYGQRHPVSAVMEVISIGEPDVCHCRFSDISEESQETIHRYVLLMQRKYLSKNKN